MRAIFSRGWLLPALILAVAVPRHAPAQTGGDRLREIETALDDYAAAKGTDQRSAIVQYLQQLDPKLVASALADHIVASRNGTEATIYNDLIETFAPTSCGVIVDRLSKADKAVPKGKLIVALRHCQGDDILHALEACLDDKRPFPFEVRGGPARRVCDLAYDEIYLKLRTNPDYGLDSSPQMKGIITEKTPVKERDALIAKLKAKLTVKVTLPAPSVPPEIVKPSTAVLPV